MPGMAPAARFSPDSLLQGNPRYKKVRNLNRGAFGFVVLAEDTHTGEKVALKFIERGPEHVTKYVEREIINHMKLRHPHIIALREVFLTVTHLVLAMEYAPGGDMHSYVAAQRGLAEEAARWFFQQLTVAVDYCHRMGVSSRDIKLENTLLDGSQRPLLKLADFGFSKDANAHSAPTSRVGTPAYLAPEVVGNQPGQTYDGQKADIWSCGVLLFVMATDAFPFSRPSDAVLNANQKMHTMLQRILRADYAFTEGRPISHELKHLIGRMLTRDPKDRISLQDIMAHPWFTQGLNPATLAFNDRIVAESLADQPSAALLAAVRLIVVQAAREEHVGAARQDGTTAGGGVPCVEIVRSSLEESVCRAEHGMEGSWEWSMRAPLAGSQFG